MTMFARRVSLSIRNVFFGVGLLSYLAVAAAGWCYMLIASHGQLALPATSVWPYLLVQGVAIPAAWLIQYKLISYIGASNTVIATTLNIVTTALLGVVALGEPVSFSFGLGAVLMSLGVILALQLQPDTHHHAHVSFARKLVLTAIGSFIFAIGMTSEKIAVDHIGAWSYMGVGWSLQAVGALTMFVLLGRHELPRITTHTISKGLLLGLLTSVAGALYVYAVSIGSLSHTIVATSGKVVVVMFLAAIFLHERNRPLQRGLALLLTMLGLWLVLS